MPDNDLTVVRVPIVIAVAVWGLAGRVVSRAEGAEAVATVDLVVEMGGHVVTTSVVCDALAFLGAHCLEVGLGVGDLTLLRGCAASRPL
jgi:hypothetical protein